MYNSSFIRWAGGKSWLIPQVKALLEGLEFNDYFEPFMGGASIFFAIDTPKKSFLSDINPELVNMFNAVKDNPKLVIKHLKSLSPDEETYYKVRDASPQGKYQRAARFLYLNANSFNGLYRVNRHGKYNVPYGGRKATVCADKLLEASDKLSSANIMCQDFFKICDKIKLGDLVFLDPPYTVSHKDNCFIAYNQNLFSIDDQERLAELMNLINNRGAYFILTNAYHEAISDIFSKCGRSIVVERNSLIGGKKSYRGKVKEYLFTNIPESEV